MVYNFQNEIVKDTDTEVGYKYSGVLEADDTPPTMVR